jgi:Bacterial protein of unknown function (DUF885)
MNRIFILFGLVTTVMLVACSAKREENRALVASSVFSSFVDAYFDAYFSTYPSKGTAAGFHQYDDKLEDMSSAAIEQRITVLKELQQRLSDLRSRSMSSGDTIDAEILEHQIRAELLELEVVQGWKRNPMLYIYLPGNAIHGLIKRDFAPPAERLKSVIARLEAIPTMLRALRENVSNPPKEFTDIAIRIASGSIGFFKGMIASWGIDAAAGDANLLQTLDKANQAVVAEMEASLAWVKKDLLPSSKGSYAIGTETFQRKLLYEDMVDLPLEKVLAIGQANLEKDYQAFVETARKIDATKTPAEVMKLISNDHPDAVDLIPSVKRTVEATRQFLIDKRIITIPSEVRPTILETPPYARVGSFASMDTPGAYETKATEAFYYVTPVEQEWSAKHKEEHLRAFNRAVMDIINIHEAYPGHYVQFLYSKQFPTKTRKLTSCGTNAEGWAHYAKQMMLEEEFSGGDSKVRLVQLHEALLRDCRYVVGIKLHTQGMSVEQGARVFVEKGFQEPANAYEEARRGTYNPTYLYYTLGKLQIYKLREDYRKARGQEYSLQGFHDDFVRQGAIPIRLVREILVPSARGSTL